MSAMTVSISVILACLLGASPVALAQIARVLDTKGANMVERAGKAPRILGQGEQLDEKDVISVARDSYAVLEFRDQTRITLRPNTVFRLDTYRDKESESMLMGLAKGGFRAVTGLIGKRNPKAVSFTTTTATIGIRGTEFDARLCADDCQGGEFIRQSGGTSAGVAGRVVEVRGLAAAARAGQAPRIVSTGSAINEGDGLATGQDSYLVVAFRDGSRITLAERSQIAVAWYRFEETPRRGQAYFKLLRGQASFQSGALAKISPDAFLFEGAFGIIRPLGTVATMNDAPACFGEGEGSCPPSILASRTGATDTPPTGTATGSTEGQSFPIAATNDARCDTPGCESSPPASGTGATDTPPSSDVSVSGPRQVLDLAMQAGAAGADAGRTFREEAGDGILRTGQMGANFLAGLSRTRGGTENRDGAARGQAPGIVSVLDGAVEVFRGGQPIRVEKGTYASIGADGMARVVTGAVDMRSAPRPDALSIDAALFDPGPKVVETGLYVWVREGAIQLGQGGQAVDVAAGGAAVATADRVALLDSVPNFMRLDRTPRPLPAGGVRVADAFVAADGSQSSMCTVR